MTPEPIRPEDINPPIFNVPGIIAGLGVLLLAIHVLVSQLLGTDRLIWVLERFAFNPAYYAFPADQLPAAGARYWSPVTYAFLHGSWLHIGINLIWMLAFGSVVARRLGVARFLALAAAGSIAGALLHYLSHMDDALPMIGASASISAFMGAAVRFAFRPNQMRVEPHAVPALTLSQSLRNRSVMTFVIIWFAVNLLFGAGLPFAGAESGVAWEAHIGGFLVGWLGFAFFDPQPRPVHDDGGN